MDAFSLLYSKLYLQNSVYLYLVPLLLHRIGNLLAYVAALFATSVCRLLSVLGREVAVSKPIFSKIFLNRGLFLSFLISLHEAVSLSCSRVCLQSAASPLCKICSDSFFMRFYLDFFHFSLFKKKETSKLHYRTA